MRTQSKSVRTYPTTDGSSALSAERFGATSKSTLPALRLVPAVTGDDGPFDEPVFQPKQLVLVIGVAISLCLLWVLVVFILYRVARVAL